MSKFLVNLLVQISKVAQNLNFKKKIEKVLLLELGPAPVFSPAVAHFLFASLTGCSPSPTGPRPLGRPCVGGTLSDCRLPCGEMPHLGPPSPLSTPS
jgi:hypothetical protein